MMRKLITVAVIRVNHCFHPCLDKKNHNKVRKKGFNKIIVKMATRHLNETPHG